VLGITGGDGRPGVSGIDTSSGGGYGVSSQSDNGTGVYVQTSGDGQT